MLAPADLPTFYEMPACCPVCGFSSYPGPYTVQDQRRITYHCGLILFKPIATGEADWQVLSGVSCACADQLLVDRLRRRLGAALAAAAAWKAAAKRYRELFRTDHTLLKEVFDWLDARHPPRGWDEHRGQDEIDLRDSVWATLFQPDPPELPDPVEATSDTIDN